METIILEILSELRQTEHIDNKRLAALIQKHNKNQGSAIRRYAKKYLLPYYLKTKETEPARWESWNIDKELEKRLVNVLRMKPRRTASGVATITVITKPWPCSSACLYCPNDVRMPKSYLCDEPACQRAERNFFDPYLQTASRLYALEQMGHPTDKIELIVLGGTWSDYPESYQIWFMKELFRALNDGTRAQNYCKKRRLQYQNLGISSERDDLQKFAEEQQHAVYTEGLSYNQAVRALYGTSEGWKAASAFQNATFDQLFEQHRINETAGHRVVGLVVETRPDAVNFQSLHLLRSLGCTKIQMGIQSIDQSILNLNNRGIGPEKIREAFELLRLFGFKIHAHMMANLYGATVEKDKQDYRRFVSEAAYLPDEVKLYPCALVKGTGLGNLYESGAWRPYTENELLDVLSADVLATPLFIRISRMIRDISAHDIVAGNKKTNLRQMVEQTVAQSGQHVHEIRYREINTNTAQASSLNLETVAYETTVSSERFLQWITPEGRIAGFLRLSLPNQAHVKAHLNDLPIGAGEAMIREVHVYGKAAELHATSEGAQHLGLGRRLVDRACSIAREQGFDTINVISAIGTREYYRTLGFHDNGLYQQRSLQQKP